MQVVYGRVRVTSNETSWNCREGDLLTIPEARHSLHALQDAVVLLTVGKDRAV